MRILTMISIALLIATLGFWGLSKFRVDRISRSVRGHQGEMVVGRTLMVTHADGLLVLCCEVYPFDFDGRFDQAQVEWRRERWDNKHQQNTLIEELVTFDFAREYHTGGMDTYLVVPYWPIAAMLGVLPAKHVLHSVRRQRRTHVGLCRNCGYDIRATPDRCPECGHAIMVSQREANHDHRDAA